MPTIISRQPPIITYVIALLNVCTLLLLGLTVLRCFHSCILFALKPNACRLALHVLLRSDQPPTHDLIYLLRLTQHSLLEHQLLKEQERNRPEFDNFFGDDDVQTLLRVCIVEDRCSQNIPYILRFFSIIQSWGE